MSGSRELVWGVGCGAPETRIPPAARTDYLAKVFAKGYLYKAASSENVHDDRTKTCLRQHGRPKLCTCALLSVCKMARHGRRVVCDNIAANAVHKRSGLHIDS